MTDHQLMLLVSQGELGMMATLFDRHHRHLYNFFLKQTNNRPASEDLTQDVFFRMLKYRHTYKEDGRFLTWMFTIAHRVKVDYYKKRSHQPEPLTDYPVLPDSSPMPDEAAEKADRHALIQKAMGQLKPQQQEILLMARYDEMRYSDIGKALGIREGSVKARVHRAMKALAREAAQLTKGDPA